jgi:hypothetical protein
MRSAWLSRRSGRAPQPADVADETPARLVEARGGVDPPFARDRRRADNGQRGAGDGLAVAEGGEQFGRAVHRTVGVARGQPQADDGGRDAGLGPDDAAFGVGGEIESG